MRSPTGGTCGARSVSTSGMRRRAALPGGQTARALATRARSVRGHSVHQAGGLPQLAPGLLPGLGRRWPIGDPDPKGDGPREPERARAVPAQHDEDGGGAGSGFADDSSSAPTRGQNSADQRSSTKAKSPSFTGAFQSLRGGATTRGQLGLRCRSSLRWPSRALAGLLRGLTNSSRCIRS